MGTKLGSVSFFGISPKTLPLLFRSLRISLSIYDFHRSIDTWRYECKLLLMPPTVYFGRNLACTFPATNPHERVGVSILLVSCAFSVRYVSSRRCLQTGTCLQSLWVRFLSPPSTTLLLPKISLRPRYETAPLWGQFTNHRTGMRCLPFAFTTDPAM